MLGENQERKWITNEQMNQKVLSIFFIEPIESEV